MKRSKAVLEKSIAYHEAGHAVAAVVQDLVIESVTIEPDKDSLGCCVHPGPLGYAWTGSRERKRLARDCILVAYAGLQAERIFDPHAEDFRAQGDEDNAFDVSREYLVLPRYCSCIGDEAHVAYLERLRGEARRLVQRNWSAVEAVAEALTKARTLSQDRVKKIIGRYAQL